MESGSDELDHEIAEVGLYIENKNMSKFLRIRRTKTSFLQGNRVWRMTYPKIQWRHPLHQSTQGQTCRPYFEEKFILRKISK